MFRTLPILCLIILYLSACDESYTLPVFSKKTSNDNVTYTKLYYSLETETDFNIKDMTENLIRNGLDLNSEAYDASRLLHRAACLDRPTLIDIFINNGAHVDSIDHFGRTALCVAAKQKSAKSLNTLIKRNAKLEGKCSSIDQTALDVLSSKLGKKKYYQNKVSDMINILVSNGAKFGANFNINNLDDSYPWFGKLVKNVDFNIKEFITGYNILYKATKNDNINLVNNLVNYLPEDKNERESILNQKGSFAKEMLCSASDEIRNILEPLGAKCSWGYNWKSNKNSRTSSNNYGSKKSHTGYGNKNSANSYYNNLMTKVPTDCETIFTQAYEDGKSTLLSDLRAAKKSEDKKDEVRTKINKLYRKLSLKHHPDRGGKHYDFTKLNNCKEALDNILQ